MLLFVLVIVFVLVIEEAHSITSTNTKKRVDSGFSAWFE